jgi:YtkA-like
MACPPRRGEVGSVPSAVAHPRRGLVAGAGLLALAALVAVALTSGRPSASSVLSRLERPASIPVAGAPTTLHAGRAGYRLALTTTPNRATVPDRLSVILTRGGRPLTGASVTVSFSMPAMKMFDVFEARMSPAGRGTYSAAEPIVGMAGLWRLSVRVVEPGRSLRTLVVDDRMRQ